MHLENKVVEVEVLIDVHAVKRGPPAEVAKKTRSVVVVASEVRASSRRRDKITNVPGEKEAGLGRKFQCIEQK